MQTTKPKRRCPVYLHPASTSNPIAITAIQSQTDLIVIANPKFSALKAVPPANAVEDFGSWGSDAA